MNCVPQLAPMTFEELDAKLDGRVVDRYARQEVMDKKFGNRTVCDKDYRFVDFNCSHFEGTYFENCNFYASSFDNCHLWHVTFIKCNLECASLSSMQVVQSSFSYCTLQDSTLNDTQWSQGNWSNSNFNNVYLTDAMLAGIDTRGSNLILLGTDRRGYLAYAYTDEDNIIHIRAGCRNFRGIARAKLHWERHKKDKELYADWMSMLDRAKKLGKAKGWRMEEENPKIPF